jgi:hypothetical protein
MLADELSDDDEENALDDRNWGWLLRLCSFFIEALIFTEFWGKIGLNLREIENFGDFLKFWFRFFL